MRKVLLLCSILLTASLVHAQEYFNKEKNEKWNLVWQDEFEGEKLDRSKWQYQVGNGFWSGTTWIDGWGNNEKEFYTDREENVKLEDGKLVITAKKESYEGEFGDGKKKYDFTSGKILTKDLFTKKYGRFEMRAKFPVGKGLWPAMWMLPQDDIYGGWASSGEIDMFEGWGSKPDTFAGTLHYGSTWPDNVHTGKEYVLENSTVEEFHDYVCEWLPGEIRWYIDGELYQVQKDWYGKNKNEAVNYTYPAPFDQDFYLIFNLAVGGWFDGEPDSKTNFPAKMEVEYIRVYDLEGGYDENVQKPETVKAELPANIKQPINGNYIYNGDFKAGKENWELLSHFGGSVDYSFEDLNGAKFLKAEISNGGEQTYSVQIIQEAPVIKGHWYKLSFDAKSIADRELNIKVGGGESRGWKAYYNNVFNLTKDVNSYSAVFQMTNDSDENAKVEFHAGLSTNDIWLGSVKLELVDNPDDEIKNMGKIPLANGNQIYNGTFDQGENNRMQFWYFDTKSNSKAEIQDRKMLVTADENDGKLYQTNLALLQDSIYDLKFKGSSDLDQEIEIKLVNKSGHKIYVAKKIKLDKEFKEYRIKLEYTDSTDLEAMFVIDFSETKGTIILDNFYMKKAVDYSNIQTTLIDDDFSDKKSMKNWTAWMGKEFGFGGDYGFYVSKGKAKLSVRDLGGELWSNMFYQNVNLTKGIKYRLSFDISSSRDREVTVAMENASYNRKTSKVIKTKKKDQHIELEFIADKTEEVGLKFLFGKYPKASKRAHDIYLDNVKLIVIQE